MSTNTHEIFTLADHPKATDDKEVTNIENDKTDGINLPVHDTPVLDETADQLQLIVLRRLRDLGYL